MPSPLKTQAALYTRVDFMALRYFFNKLPLATIWNLYTEDDLYTRGINSHEQLRGWLTSLRNTLIEGAKKENPQLKQVLEQALHTDTWYRQLSDHLCELGERDYSAPALTDSLSLWFRKYILTALHSEDLTTLGELKQLIERRGRGWYRPIARIGRGRAQAISQWLEANSEHLGKLNWPNETLDTSYRVLVPDPIAPWVPFNQIKRIDSELDGSNGLNRSDSFCLISASNDLEALHAYLYKFRGQAATLRAYTKEVERFLLWAVAYRRTALSNVLTEDCEAFKDFIANPPASWIGSRAVRTSNPQWRPFAGPLSPTSQRYAVQVIRGCFEWLVNVRYLNANPWITVSDPQVDQREHRMQIDSALPGSVWDLLASPGGWLDQACEILASKDISESFAPPLLPTSPYMPQVQMRLARAVICMLGYSGIRRAELIGAQRSELKPVPNTELWELRVLGKRRKWRTVFLPRPAIDALKAHWEDRLLDFDDTQTHAEAHLISPVVIPNTPAARDKHDAVELLSQGFASDGFYRLMQRAIGSLIQLPEIELTEANRNALLALHPHALRHTFATSAAAKQMPLDVLSRLLGHVSIDTTSIYVQAERERSIEEVQKLFG